MLAANQFSTIPLFRDLPDEAKEALRGALTAQSFSPGDMLLRQGAAPEHVFFILAGTVQVVLTDPQGNRHVLATQGPGELLGERALLTGETRTADVIAHTPVEAAELDSATFTRLLARHPELGAALSRRMARQLGNWAIRHQKDEQESRELLSNLVGWQNLPEFDDFPGNTPWAKALNQRLAELAVQDCPVLIVGEAGTWKELTARLIHYHSIGTNQHRPILFLDCSAPPPVLRSSEASSQPPTDHLAMKIAQESALFGHEPDSAIYARGTRRGYLELAEGGTLILENVEFLSPAVQELLADYLKNGRFRRRGEQTYRHSRTRLIATGCEELTALAESGSFNSELLRQLQKETLQLLPLRLRKKDIPIIARQLLPQLNRKHHKQVRKLSRASINALLDYDWPLNGKELQQVMDLAVAVCEGQEIQADQIFLHLAPSGGQSRFNLLKLPLLDRFAHSPPLLKGLNLVTAGSFALILLALFAGSLPAATANLAVWALWWPLLLISALVAARFWCSICPLESLSRLSAIGRQNFIAVPGSLRRYGPWLALAGFGAILMAEQVHGLFDNAGGTGILLVALLAAASLSYQLFGPRVWCKFICPLGRMLSGLARLSLVEMQSTSSVCTSQCQVNECIKGRSCPMGLHPTAVNASDDCILCLACVRNCPHQAMRLNLRLPWNGLLARQRRTLAVALFALTALGSALAIRLTPQLFPGDRYSGSFAVTYLAVLATVTGATLLATADRSLRRWKHHFILGGTALLPLAAAGLFNVFFRETIDKGEHLLPWLIELIRLDRWIDPALATPELGTLNAIPPLVTLGGGLISWITINRMAQTSGWARRSNYLLRGLLLSLTAALLYWL